MYWAFTTITTVGYGDISAQNSSEMAVSVVSMLVGVHVFTSVASTLNAGITAKASAKMEAEKKINIIASFLSLRRVPGQLAGKIQDFYSRKYLHEVAEFDVAGLLDELPSVLSAQLEDYLYSKYRKIHSMSFWNILMFDQLDAQDARYFCYALDPMFLAGSSVVYNQDAASCGIYIIVTGHVTLRRLAAADFCQPGRLRQLDEVQPQRQHGLPADRSSEGAYLLEQTYKKGQTFGEVESLPACKRDSAVPVSRWRAPPPCTRAHDRCDCVCTASRVAESCRRCHPLSGTAAPRSAARVGRSCSI